MALCNGTVILLLLTWMTSSAHSYGLWCSSLDFITCVSTLQRLGVSIVITVWAWKEESSCYCDWCGEGMIINALSKTPEYSGCTKVVAISVWIPGEMCVLIMPIIILLQTIFFMLEITQLLLLSWATVQCRTIKIHKKYMAWHLCPGTVLPLQTHPAVPTGS